MHQAYEVLGHVFAVIKSSHEMGCMLTVRLQNKSGEWVWVNMVMHIRQPFICDNGDPAIVCINHVIHEVEAHHFKAQSQLYSSHIARSPEFLPSPQRVSPPHTITQVPVEQEQYPIQGYQVQQQQQQGDGTGMGFYHAQFGAAVTTASGSENGSTGIEHVMALNLDASTYQVGGSQYGNSAEVQKQIVRAGLRDKLKRRKIKQAEQEQCMPPVKMPRYSNDVGGPEGSPAGVSLTVKGSILSGTGLELPAGFAVAGVGGPQMLVQQAGSHMCEQLALRKPVELVEQMPQVMPSVREMAPPTPPTPDSLPDCTTATSATTAAITTGLTVEMGDAALVPPCILTPESSPAASPTNSTVATLEQSQCVPSLFSDLADIQVLTDIDTDMDPEPRLITQIKTLKVEEVREKRLPELDSDSLENYLFNISGGENKQEVQLQQEATYQPSVQVVENLAEQAMIPQTVVDISEDDYSDASSPATSTASLEEIANSSEDLLKMGVWNETQFDGLIDVFMGLAQTNRTAAPGVDISGGIVMVPDHSTALADSPVQACPEAATSSQTGTDGIGDNGQILSPEVTGELIDELHQLNELAGSAPSYGKARHHLVLFAFTLIPVLCAQC